MTTHLHKLIGCSPTPLSNYLKAIGILRLVSEQTDATARGWWQDEHFCLACSLTRDELQNFFLTTYQPTPIVSPWNKGSGFYKSNDPGLAPLERSSASRFERFRQGASEARMLLDSVSNADGVIRSIKARTKTNKSFQTDEQRELLSKSEVFSQTLLLIEQLVAKPGISDDDRKKLRDEIAVIGGLVLPTTRPATKAEADRLKDHSDTSVFSPPLIGDSKA